MVIEMMFLLARGWVCEQPSFSKDQLINHFAVISRAVLKKIIWDYFFVDLRSFHRLVLDCAYYGGLYLLDWRGFIPFRGHSEQEVVLKLIQVRSDCGYRYVVHIANCAGAACSKDKVIFGCLVCRY